LLLPPFSPRPVCTVRERKHTYRTSEKVCNKAQLYEYKQQEQTEPDNIYFIFSFIKDVKVSNITWQSSIILISLQTAPIQLNTNIIHPLHKTLRSHWFDGDLQDAIFMARRTAIESMQHVAFWNDQKRVKVQNSIKRFPASLL